MNPRQNFYSSVFEQIMNYKKEREFEGHTNFLFDPVVGLGLFASALVVGVFSGYLPLPSLSVYKSNQVAVAPIIKIEERAAADVFSPDKSNAAENDLVASSNAFVLVPSEDSYVSADSPQKSFGSETYLKIDKAAQKSAYLKFKLPQGTSFSKALLKLSPTDSNPNGGKLAVLTENLWSEKLLTFDSRPSSEETPIGAIGAISSRVAKTIDVTSYVKAGSTYTFKISTEGSDSIGYSSREASTETSPALLLVK
jgi:hypothetical protein